MLSITYGIDVKSVDNQFLNGNVGAGHALSAVMVPGKFPTDTIPIRACATTQTVTYKRLTNPMKAQYVPDRRFPRAGLKALAQEARDKFGMSVDGPLEHVESGEGFSHSTASDCLKDRVPLLR